MSLKANHPTVYAGVKAWFESAHSNHFEGIEYSYNVRVEAGHHRQENRQIWAVTVACIADLYQPSPWAGLQSVVMVIRVRQLWNKTTREVQFYLSSLPCDAVKIGRAIRAGALKTNFTLVLDVTIGEDASRIRTGLCPENFALMRRMAMNLLNQETSTKRSLRHIIIGQYVGFGALILGSLPG